MERRGFLGMLIGVATAAVAPVTTSESPVTTTTSMLVEPLPIPWMCSGQVGVVGVDWGKEDAQSCLLGVERRGEITIIGEWVP